MEKKYGFPILKLKVFKVSFSSKWDLKTPINGVEVKMDKKSVTLRL